MKRLLDIIRKAADRGRLCILVGAVSLVGVVCAFGGCSAPNNQFSSTDTAMGTIIRQNVYAEDEETAQAFMSDVKKELDRLENQVLSWRAETSQVFEINEAAYLEKECTLTDELSGILEKVWKVSEDSGGALDVTIGQVTRLWRIDEYAAEGGMEDFQIPASEMLKQVLDQTGYDKVKLSKGRIALLKGMSLDLGAVGKGVACDSIQGLLGASGISGAVISVGGSILTYGEKPDGSAWKVGIVNPHDTSSYIGTLTLTGQWCVSTSGDYERYVEADGVRYHHILDPHTGYPADAGLSSVTILSHDGCLSDALSTACFVLGKEKALKLLEQYDAYAVFVEHSGNIVLSPGMDGYVTVQP